MCRHLAYVGPPVPLGPLLFDAPHALVEQARAPRLQESGRDNPDGWGVGWYDDPRNAPLVYRSVQPMWRDAGFSGSQARADAVLAAARHASPGSSRDTRNNAPFASGAWLFSLNGVVHGFRDGVADGLRARVSPARATGIEGDTDSELLFALVLDRLDSGASPGEALAAVVDDVESLTDGRLNLLVTNGALVAATAVGNSLFTRVLVGGGTFVASEPLDDEPEWSRAPERSVVEADAENCRTSPLGSARP